MSYEQGYSVHNHKLRCQQCIVNVPSGGAFLQSEPQQSNPEWVTEELQIPNQQTTREHEKDENKTKYVLSGTAQICSVW